MYSVTTFIESLKVTRYSKKSFITKEKRVLMTFCVVVQIIFTLSFLVILFLRFHRVSPLLSYTGRLRPNKLIQCSSRVKPDICPEDEAVDQINSNINIAVPEVIAKEKILVPSKPMKALRKPQ